MRPEETRHIKEKRSNDRLRVRGTEESNGLGEIKKTQNILSAMRKMWRAIIDLTEGTR